MGKSACFLQLFLVLVVAISVKFCYGDDSDPYRHTVVLDRHGKYVLEWRVNWEERRVHFDVTVETRGYVGFGLSRKGRMAGADIVIGGVFPNGTAYFTDRHAIGQQKPIIDDSQDWTLHSAKESRTHTSVSFSRPFETCDEDHDIPINEDNLSLIWAYGEKDNDSEYHFQNRGNYSVYLLDADLTPREIQMLGYENVTEPVSVPQFGDLKVWRIPMKDRILPQDTSYICTFHKAPSEPRKQHIVGFRSILNSNLERRHIHHFLLHICRPPDGTEAHDIFEPFVGQPGEECYVLTNPSSRIPGRYCREVVHEWAVGARPVFFPEHVGIPFLESPEEYYLLQMHYDNPDSLPNLEMNFELEVFYTDHLRQHDVGVMYIGVGTPGSPSILVPPSSLDHVQYGHCGSECTKKLLPTDGITIFAAKPHTHLAGVGTRMLHIHNGKEMPVIIDDNYNFNFQPIKILPNEVKVLPGDMIVKRCVYATTNRNYATVGGFSTRNEMCNGFVWFYPRLRSDAVGVCSSEIRSNVYRNFLQISNTTWSDQRRENIVTAPPSNAGLTVSEVGTNMIDWTIDNRIQLQAHQQLLPQVTICPTIGPEEHLGPVTRNVDNTAKKSRALRRFSLRMENFSSGLMMTDLNNEINDANNEFVSLMPTNLQPYQRPSQCLHHK